MHEIIAEINDKDFQDYGLDGCREVVRCKDCKHYAGEGIRCAWNICVHFDNFYCYYGVRKEE